MDGATAKRHGMERGAQASRQAWLETAQREAQTHRRTLFATIDAVTIGGMVAIGVFCRRADGYSRG